MTAVNRFFPHWTLQNFVALSLSFNAVSLLRLDSFWTVSGSYLDIVSLAHMLHYHQGSALLSGLFLYDSELCGGRIQAMADTSTAGSLVGVWNECDGVSRARL